MFPWPFTIELKVPWRDLDAAGHVNNAVYFSYMETARTEAFLAMRGKTDWRDLDIILARAACDFRSQASFGETLTVSVWPGRVGSSSFGLRYEIREKTTGRLIAEGDSVQVFFDYARNSKKFVPPEMKAMLESGAA